MALPVWAFWLAIALIVVGLLGIFLPLIPGVGFIWIVILAYAIAERFATVDPLSFAFLTILGLAGATTDVWTSMLGAKVSGASMATTLCSLVGATVGGCIGLLFAGIGVVPGMIIGSILGVLFSSYREHREWKAMWKAALGVVVGFTLSSLLQLSIGVIMLVLFVWQVLRG